LRLFDGKFGSDRLRELPRQPGLYLFLDAKGLRAEPALLVRGSSRRITIMRYRPANIRVINRRDSRVDRLRCCYRNRSKIELT
jgi:hypothetical protein